MDFFNVFLHIKKIKYKLKSRIMGVSKQKFCKVIPRKLIFIK